MNSLRHDKRDAVPQPRMSDGTFGRKPRKAVFTKVDVIVPIIFDFLLGI